MGKGEGWGEGSGEGEGQGSGAAEFANGLFGCMNNCSNCLCGYFCWCCLSYQNANKLGKSGCLHTILSCVSPCIPAFLQVCINLKQTNVASSTKTEKNKKMLILFQYT